MVQEFVCGWFPPGSECSQEWKQSAVNLLQVTCDMSVNLGQSVSHRPQCSFDNVLELHAAKLWTFWSFMKEKVVNFFPPVKPTSWMARNIHDFALSALKCKWRVWSATVLRSLSFWETMKFVYHSVSGSAVSKNSECFNHSVLFFFFLFYLEKYFRASNFFRLWGMIYRLFA